MLNQSTISVDSDLTSSLPAPSSPSPSGTSPDPCPTPLAWQEVLREVADAAQPFDAMTAAGPVRGIICGSGYPVYFLNGLSGDLTLYALTAYLLRDEAACVMFNYPDAAESRCPPEEVVSRLAVSVQDLATRFGHERITLYAAGFGGLPALQLLHASPTLVNEAVLQGAYAHRDFRRSERALFAMGRRWPGRLSSLPAWGRVQQQNHRTWFPPFDPTRWEFLVRNLGATRTASAALRASAAAATDVRPILESIHTPVLIVRTEGEGRLAAAAQVELEQRLPQTRVEWLHTAGHYPHLTHPHRLVKLIRTAMPSGVGSG